MEEWMQPPIFDFDSKINGHQMSLDEIARIKNEIEKLWNPNKLQNLPNPPKYNEDPPAYNFIQQKSKHETTRELLKLRVQLKKMQKSSLLPYYTRLISPK